MYRSWLTHILPCALVPLFFATSVVAQDRPAPPLPTPYQKWLDEDVAYLITNEERAEFAKLESNEERDKFIEDFWQSRNPNPTPEWNPFKEEHYRRLAYANEQFAASVPGWKTDRGRIYILYGPPDEREQHPANHNLNLPEDASPMRRYATDTWIYHFLPHVGQNLFFIFVDECECGKYKLIHDPTKKRSRQQRNREQVVPVKQIVIP